jgi:DNA-binding MarR family transcriptional regulator
LFVSSHLHQLFPEDIENNIDIFIAGNYSGPLISSLQGILVDEGLISESRPIIAAFPLLPCFGQSSLIDPNFNVPHWDMQLEEIYEVIEKYNLPRKHIETILRNLIAKTKRKITFSTNGESEEFDLSEISLSNFSVKKERFLLARALFDFLQETKSKSNIKHCDQFLDLKNRGEIYELSKAFKSPLAMDILALADKGYSVSEIARKLNKHTSNISTAISALKQKGLVRTNGNGEVEKAVRVIKINL